MSELDRYVTAGIVQTGDETQIVQWLHSHTDIRSSDFDYVFFCGPDGIAYIDSGTAPTVSDREYFKEIMQKGKSEYIDDPVLSRTTGKPVIHVVKAVAIGRKTIGFFAGVVPVRKQ